MGSQNRIQAITALTFDTSNLTVGYQLVGTLTEACYYIKFVNGSNNIIFINYGGINQNDIMLANSTIEISAPTNHVPKTAPVWFAKGMPINVTSGTSNVGTLYIIGYYQS